MKRITARLTEEQIAFLRNDGGISVGLRKAVTQLQKQRKFRVQLERTYSGYVYMNFQAKDFHDLLEQINVIKKQLPDEFKDKFWYIYKIEELPT